MADWDDDEFEVAEPKAPGARYAGCRIVISHSKRVVDHHILGIILKIWTNLKLFL